MLEEILKDNFVEYGEVYKKAAEMGMSKQEVRAEKISLGVKTISLVNGDEVIWLWYIPKNVWSKYSPRQ